MAIKMELVKDALELEVDTNKIDASHMEAVATLSIAISLKRIADVLEGKPDRYGLIDALFEIHERKQRGI